MCGISGILLADSDLQPDRIVLADSVRLLQHRGPDDNSLVVGPGFGFGHARLSLVDLDARSNQPFADASGRYMLVYNGEIYNFRELRAELETRGRTFRTRSDTEVVLQLLIEYEPATALPRLNGMFALGFFDKQTGMTVLARDRFGEKPLYWAEAMTSGTKALVFASEVKALRPWMRLEPEIEPIIAYLLRYPGPMQGRTMFRRIHSLGPGEYLTRHADGRIESNHFASLTDLLDDAEMDRLAGLSPTRVADEFDALMTESVRTHMFADASVGAFCSGGVDSSLIVALAARQKKDVALFHANVDGPWSELDAAKALARHLGLELHVANVVEQDFVDMIPKVMGHYEQPFTYHPNCPPLMMIAQLARDSGVKGLMSGEGSDELFLGYPWLGRKRVTDAYDAIVAAAGRLLRGLPGLGPVLLPERAANLPDTMAILTRHEQAEDLELVHNGQRPFARTAADPTYGWTLDYMHHHLRTLLHRNDTMGMAAGIEARFPFLDLGVARFGANLPGKYKLRRSLMVWEKAHPFMRDKWVVRAVAARYMPPGLSRRIKVGFWTTTFQRMKADPAFYASSRLGDLLHLSRRQIDRTVQGADHDMRLRLLHLDVWTRVMVDGEDPAISVERPREHVHIRAPGAQPRFARTTLPRRSASAPI
jgi:asparagine synthase (glutamine-hydrolysing)